MKFWQKSDRAAANEDGLLLDIKQMDASRAMVEPKGVVDCARKDERAVPPCDRRCVGCGNSKEPQFNTRVCWGRLY